MIMNMQKEKQQKLQTSSLGNSSQMQNASASLGSIHKKLFSQA